MKKDRLARLPLKAPAGKENDLEYWKSKLAQAIESLKSYKRRQDDIVFDLGKIQKRPDLADVIIQGMLDITLAVASKRVRDREEALTILVKMLTIPAGSESDSDYLAHRVRIRELVPDLFEESATGQEKPE